MLPTATESVWNQPTTNQ